jgi:Tfp pilus assembly protein PilF
MMKGYGSGFGRCNGDACRAGVAETTAAVRGRYDKAQADAHQALILAPNLAQGHLAIANVSELGDLDFTQASAAYERALALAPGNAEVLRNYSRRI